MKTMYSPTCTRKILMTPPMKTDENEDNEPRQILLPIGGGLIGKLATSTTSLSYRKISLLYSIMSTLAFCVS